MTAAPLARHTGRHPNRNPVQLTPARPADYERGATGACAHACGRRIRPSRRALPCFSSSPCRSRAAGSGTFMSDASRFNRGSTKHALSRQLRRTRSSAQLRKFFAARELQKSLELDLSHERLPRSPLILRALNKHNRAAFQAPARVSPCASQVWSTAHRGGLHRRDLDTASASAF